MQSILTIFGNADDIQGAFFRISGNSSSESEGRGAERDYTHGEKEIMAEKERRENGIPVNDNTMVELANLCNYLKIDFGAYFKDYELPKDSKFSAEIIKHKLLNRNHLTDNINYKIF